MKRVVELTANDGDSSVTIRAVFKSDKSLCASEREHVVKQLKRHLSEALRGISYTDFGIENTTLR